MKRTCIERLITEKSLAAVNNSALRSALEHAIETDSTGLEIKNVCTKVTAMMVQKIDNICSLLNITKREFCEKAFADAIEKAEAIIEAEGVYEALFPEGKEQAA